MGITPDKYIKDLSGSIKRKWEEHDSKPMNGWLAISPLIVFICIYVVSSLIANDFYKIPISSAFMIASIYAVLICRGRSLEQRIAAFSEGAGNRNILLMIWIFVLAGAFASTAKDMGAIDATVNAALAILPGKLIYAGLFLASCFVSMSIGTSVGTIVALVPVGAGIAQEIAGGSGAETAFITAIIVGGSFFGDNLSFISDTTIAATRTQGCSMRDKFKANIRIVLPAAIVVTAVYIIMGSDVSAIPESLPIEWIKLIPYILVIAMALSGVHVTTVLTTGLAANMIIGTSAGGFTWNSFLESAGKGISGMGDLIIVTMLAGGMLELIRLNGGLEFITRGLTKRINGKRGAELSIAGLVSLANMCTANNTVAIITTGCIAKEISDKYGIDPRKTASILDTFSCLVQGMIPYGAQLLMAGGLADVSMISIMEYLYYPFTMGLFAFLAIMFRFPKKYS